MVVPRDLLLAVRGEIRAWSAHWAQGFTAAGDALVKHDKRMADGSCATCALLEVLNAYLHTDPPPTVTAVQPSQGEVPVNLGDRRRVRPGGGDLATPGTVIHINPVVEQPGPSAVDVAAEVVRRGGGPGRMR